MRPSPLLLLALVAGGFALIAVPLARLTWAERAWRGGEAISADVPAGVGEVGEVPALVRIRFAHAPVRVVLTHDGRRVAEFGVPDEPGGGPADGQMERAVFVRVVEDEPLDVLVEATWPDGTPLTALGVEVEPDGFETRRATVWAEGAALVELMTFSWK